MSQISLDVGPAYLVHIGIGYVRGFSALKAGESIIVYSRRQEVAPTRRRQSHGREQTDGRETGNLL